MKNIPAGNTVNVTLTDRLGNAVSGKTVALANNTYRIALDASGLIDGRGAKAVATALDLYGVTREYTRNIGLNLIDGEVDSVPTVANADGVVHITGTSQDIYQGSEITIVITDKNGNSVTATTTAKADGTYDLTVDTSSLADGDVTVTTTSVDNNDFSVTDTDVITLDHIAGGLSTDATINANGTADISGTSTDVPAGSVVTITITDANGNSLTTTATVNPDGTYAANGVDVSGLADGTLTITATATDNNGNALTATDSETLDLGIEAQITLNNVTADNIVNAAEAKGKITLSGKVTGDFTAGDSVRIYLDDNTYFTRKVDANGNFSVAGVPASLLVNDADKTIKAVITTADAAGNRTTAEGVKTYQVATKAPEVSVSVNDITADNIINATEASGTIALTGTVAGEFNAGDVVSVNVNGKTYTTTVNADGNFSVNVAGSDLVADSDNTITATISTTDSYGNSATVSSDKAYGVDIIAPQAQIVLHNVTADNVLTSREAAGNITLTGSVTGEFNAGDSVRIYLDNATYYTRKVDANGNFSLTVAGSALMNDADKTIKAVLTTTDAAGNTATITTSKTYAVEAYGEATLNFMTNSVISDSLTATYASYPTHSTARTVTRDGNLGYQTGAKKDIITVNNYVTGKSVINTYGGDDIVKVGTNIDFSQVHLGEGHNTLIVGAANRVDGYITNRSIVTAGAGDDYVAVRTNIDTSNINLGNGNNTLVVGTNNVDGYITGSATQIVMGSGNDVLDVRTNISASTINLGNGDNTINVGGWIVGTAANITTGNGNDVMKVGTNVDAATINLGAGNDSLTIGGYIAGTAKINLGSGDDTVSVGGNISPAAKLNFGTGDDTLVFTGAKQTANLGSLTGVETIDLHGKGANTLTGVTLKNVLANGSELFIKGGYDDKVDLGNVGVSKRDGTGSWQKVSDVTVDGVSYDGWAHTSSYNNVVYIQEGVQVL
ncbi:beta strand repeat-containing protein [Moraxella caviae]|uniref:beta strand repeat-containing protein n=1 Tax=Moraxella caviae TaxID=34060 RepID=UPI001300D325|nr:Ig-like domain-containing protein [Moraxella caviae]